MGASILVGTLALAVQATAGPTEELTPAGSINGVFANGPHAFIVGEDADVAAYARQVQQQFLPDAAVLAGAEALEADLAGTNLLVYGTPADNAWLAQHAERLPVRLGERELWLQERHFEGAHLRAICSVRNPDDLTRRAIVYTAPEPADVVGINNLFHGPTEWVVADGGKLLASGSYVSVGPFPVELLAADLEYLVATLANVHPATADGLPAELRDAIRTARSAIASPMGRAEFWRVANEVLLAMHDAHTSMGLLASGETIDLPLAWLADELVVARDTARLARGDRVLSIGGRTPDELLAALASVIPAETTWWLRHRGESALTSSGTLLLLGAEVTDAVGVRLERDGQEVELGLPLGEAVQPAPSLPWARFEIDAEHDLAIFTLDRCQIDDFYRGRVRAFFEAVLGAGIGRVVVDVRANSGGNSGVVDEFLRYLPVESYRSYSGAIRVSAESTAQRGDDGREPGYHEFGPQERENRRVEDLPPFEGEVFVLTSSGTFSSGNWFAVILQDNGLATVVGEPTGNAPSSYGDVLQFELPGTCLSFSMSYKRWIRPDPERDPATCLEPDERIVRTRADILAQRDPVLDALRARGEGPR